MKFPFSLKFKSSFLFVVVFLFISFNSFAQKPVLSEDFTLSAGEKYKRIKSIGTYNIASGYGLASIKKGRTDMTIQRYSVKDLKEDIKKRQVIEDKGDFQTVMELGGKAVVFYINKNKAYAQRISLTGIIAEKPVLVGSDKENIHRDFGFKGTRGFDAGGRINQFAFKKSPDGSKLVVVFRIKTANDKADKIGINVYDTNLELQWRRKVRLPYASKKMMNEDFAVDNEGNFYMTTSIFSGADAENDKLEANYDTEVYKIAEDPTEFQKNRIDIAGKVITDAIIGKDRNGRMRVSGFYSDKTNKIEIAGMFSAQLGDDGAVVELFHSDIPVEAVQKYVEERETRINEGSQNKKDLLSFESIKVNDVIYRGDGSAVVLGEQRYAESFTTSSSSGSRTTYKYYYRDIIATKLKPNNTIDWFYKLPKDQIGVMGKRSMSYYNFEANNKHYLFHVDNFNNIKRSLDEMPTKYFDGKKDFVYLMSYTIDDATGEMIKEPILTGSDLRNARLDMLRLHKVGRLLNKDLFFEVFDGKKNNLMFKISLTK